jgi:hypothetical protein
LTMKYFEALLNTIDGWNAEPIADEWLFEEFREKFVDVMSPAEAFEFIDVTIEILRLQNDESTATEVLQTVIGLARHSETTQVPNTLLAQKQKLEEQFANFGDYAKSKLLELLRYYRLQDQG